MDRRFVERTLMFNRSGVTRVGLVGLAWAGIVKVGAEMLRVPDLGPHL